MAGRIDPHCGSFNAFTPMICRAVILNDTRRARDHLGCLTVMSNLIYLCRKSGIEVVRTIEPTAAMAESTYHEALAGADVVIVNGEGTMHHDAPAALDLALAVRHAKAAGKITALVNAVWQGNRELNASLSKYDFIATRDSFSQAECRAGGAAAPYIAPDLSFFCQEAPPELSTRILHQAPPLCLVVDSVFQPLSLQLYDYAALQRLPFRMMVSWFWQKGLSNHPIGRSHPLSLVELRQAPALIVGRFHAVCLAMKFGVPFVTFSSNTHKVEALLTDAGLPGQDFLLPRDWEQRPANFWVEYAQDRHERHRETIQRFVRRSSAEIATVFADLAFMCRERLSNRRDKLQLVQPETCVGQENI